MFLNFVVMLLQYIRADGKFADAVAFYFFQPINNVFQLCFGQANEGVVDQHVGAQHQKGIWCVGQRRAEIGFG